MEGEGSGRGASALHPASGENWLILKGKTFKYTKDILTPQTGKQIDRVNQLQHDRVTLL